MQYAEIEIIASEPHEAIEAGINQTAEKFGVDLIQVKRYSVYEIENHFMVPGRAWRVSLDFEEDPEKFDDSFAEEGFIGQFECE
jgi:hypothetical protein